MEERLHHKGPFFTSIDGMKPAVEAALATLPKGASNIKVSIGMPAICGMDGFSVVVRGKEFPVVFQPIDTPAPFSFTLQYGLGNLE